MPRMRAWARPGPRKLPQQQRSRELYEAVLQAAAEVLERDGPSFTLQAVIERAGVSPGSFYQYFSEREALVAALLDRQMDADRALLARLREEGRPGPEQDAFAHLVDGVFELYARAPRTMSHLFELHQQLGRGDELKELIEEFVTFCREVVLSHLPPHESDAAVFALLALVRRTAETQPSLFAEAGYKERLLSVARSAGGESWDGGGGK